MKTNPQSVPCRYCGAQQNQPCTNRITGQKLRNFTAHQRRIDDRKRTIIGPPIIDEDDEVIF